ncbi:ABC transporter substrate-binding protein [Erysipelothrix sp. HDW6C]|uniref:ABC transporter substrate-binding protein n=1 Tax=Erysipelothrix sp. HDW6C TaxID=2714930 RepID=UPI00140E0E3E|nr:ABC transporter substrate-binding protein [Erysipelothrix sp. HDW6C]QIK70495.1 ABC transporter substrate-binding protein [Erysipelothrix sp. HDW6C]
MKRFAVVLLAALLVLTGCGSKSGPSADKVLTVAAPASLNGDFVNGFGTNAYDQWAVKLMSGYDTFYVDPTTAELKLDESVVKQLVTTDNADGSKTYTFTLNEGLKFSDGEALTAKSYVGALLFRGQAGWLEQAKMDSTGYDLVGYEAYSKGEADKFEGVKYIDDSNFSVTIAADRLPYYFETSYATVSPEPMHVWFPEAKLNADGNGFDNTAEEIAAAVKNVSEKERFKPTVSAGPYVLETYENNQAVLVANENYAGNFEGKKPSIGKVVIKLVESDVTVQALGNGEIDLSPGNIESSVIEPSKEAGYQLISYPRNGYGMIQFKANKGPTQITEVRQAIGYLLDRNEFVSKVVGGYGVVVNAPFGLSQWFYKENKDELDNDLIQYTFNLTKANELLDTTDYKFESDGTTAFDPAKANSDAATNYFRYNSKGEKLVIKHFGSEKNAVTDLVVSQLVPNAKAAGIEYFVQQGEFSTLGDYMQGRVENDYNAFNLATSFTSIYDPYTGHHSDWVGSGLNWGDIADPELDAAIMNLRNRAPEDREGFSKAVVEYFKVWNKLLPSVPLYSNQYFDIALDRVTGLDSITPELDWARQIVYIDVK